MSVGLTPMLEVSDYAGTLQGWRLWIATRHKIRYIDPSTGVKRKRRGPYLLRSIVSDDLWRPKRAMIADCNQTPGYLFDLTHKDDDDICPDSGCKCGIYAVESLEKLMGIYDGTTKLFFRFDMEIHAAVVGKVNIWGKVIPGEWGWRGQYAYPSELYIVDTLAGKVTNRHSHLLNDLKNYEVPIGLMAPRDLISHRNGAPAAGEEDGQEDLRIEDVATGDEVLRIDEVATGDEVLRIDDVATGDEEDGEPGGDDGISEAIADDEEEVKEPDEDLADEDEDESEDSEDSSDSDDSDESESSDDSDESDESGDSDDAAKSS